MEDKEIFIPLRAKYVVLILIGKPSKWESVASELLFRTFCEAWPLKEVSNEGFDRLILVLVPHLVTAINDGRVIPYVIPIEIK